MGRLKKDHDGYRTSGLWLKYQTPQVNERNIPPKSKKNTTLWCRGKVGREHTWHRFEQMRWNDEIWDFLGKTIEIRCVDCGKEKYIKTAKAAGYPLHIWVDQKYCGVDPVQVKVNGEYKPLTHFDFKRGGHHYCWRCGYCH